MRAVIQRVKRASVSAHGEVLGEIGAGLCVLVLSLIHISEPTRLL